MRRRGEPRPAAGRPRLPRHQALGHNPGDQEQSVSCQVQGSTHLTLQGTNLATEDDPELPGSGGQAYTVYEQVVGIFNKEKALEVVPQID